jgi:hypothetical protein
MTSITEQNRTKGLGDVWRRQYNEKFISKTSAPSTLHRLFSR